MARADRREPLTRERVLRAALDLIDAEGLDALTMRALGVALGVEAMSLYRYVSGRDAVLDGVLEVALSESPAARKGLSPRASVRALAIGLRAVLGRHPNAIPVFVRRPAVTPASLAQVESALDGFRRAGMHPREALGALQVVAAYVLGHAAMTLVPQASGASVDYAALDPERFPRLRESARAVAARDVESEFTRGLDALLDGLFRD